MIKISKKEVYNFNLFLLVIALGLLMYWKKYNHTEIKTAPIFSQTTETTPGSSITKARFEK